MWQLIKIAIVVHILFMFFGSIWLMHKDYDLPEKDVMDIGKVWSDDNLLKKLLWALDDVDLAGVRSDFHEKFPYILSAERFPPLQIRTGGLLGQVHLLYASLSEILLIYHSPLHTSGDSGRHFMNISVTVLKGKVSTWSSESSVVEEYSPAGRYSYKIGERHFLEMEHGSYILIHGRGLVPLSLWYGVANSLFSNFDPCSAILTVSYYTRAVYSNWNIQEYFNNVYMLMWNSASNVLEYIPQVFDSIRDTLVSISQRIYRQGKQILDV